MTVRSPKGPGCLPDDRAAPRDPTLAVRRLRWAILLNSLFIAVELAAGFAVNSLALLSDAWHNFTDVLGLAIAWFAVRQHVWSLGGDLTALSCHVVVENQPVSSSSLLVERLQRELRDRFRIGHITLQLEAATAAAGDPPPIRYEGETVQRLARVS